MSRKNIRTRLFWLFILIGALPLFIVLVISGFRRVSSMEQEAKEDMWVKTSMIDNHVTDLMEMNLQVLQVSAVNPLIQQYVATRGTEQKELAERVLNDTNWIFKDSNLMALTSADGRQLFRTDKAPLVDVNGREHYRQSMMGKNFVSNVIKSKSTGEEIVVLEAPVKNNDYQVIGMIQRNFDIKAFQSFISALSEEHASVILMDREGAVIAHSNRHLLEDSDDRPVIPYQTVSQAMSGVFGVQRTEVDGVDSLVGYKRNSLTGWPIIIVYPYKYIFEAVNAEMARLTGMGLLCLLLVGIMSFRFAGKASQPILDVLHGARQLAGGANQVKDVKISTNDEVEEIAHVFREMQVERDAYRRETERDTLTGLYTENAVEAICHKKLNLYNLSEQKFDSIAFYIIDLDRFKKLNETYGRLYGDRVLLEFAQRLRRIFRPLDCVGRMEADEFIAVADQITDTAEVLKKAAHINQMARSLVLDEQPVELTASIGIALFPRNGASYETVLRSAREALSKAKQEGRDNFHCLAA